MSVKLRLKELRKSRRLTQAQVSAGINCSVPTYSRYESGARQPSLETLERLAACGAEVFRTDLGGAVNVTADDGYVRVETYR